MRILVAHSRYRQPGGEETVFEQEVALLQGAGHEVIIHDRSNWEAADYSLLKKAALPLQVIWSNRARQDIRDLLRKTRPDIAHFHNTHYMLSPAVYYACQEADVPVVQTLHNYRLICANGWFFRDSHVCEDCMGKTPPWPGIVHACYRHSHLQTAVMTGMLTAHRWLGTWQNCVDQYIALTDFLRSKLVAGGVPAGKITVKSNFLHPDPGLGAGSGGYALFAGRLSSEKGVQILLDAWNELGGRLPLKIVGDGPLGPVVASQAERMPHVEWLGRLTRDDVLAVMRDAFVLVFPSISYEVFPMVLVEAFATGLPAIGSALGNTRSIIVPGQTGLHFAPGDARDLAEKVRWLLNHPAEYQTMRQAARAEFEAKYTAQISYERTMEIYRTVLASRSINV